MGEHRKVIGWFGLKHFELCFRPTPEITLQQMFLCRLLLTSPAIDNAMEFVMEHGLVEFFEIQEIKRIGTKVTYMWSGTQAEYDALPTKDDTTMYLITG